MKEKVMSGIKNIKLKATDVLLGASCGLAVPAVMIFPNAEGSITAAGLTAAASSISDEITAIIPIALGVMGTILCVKVGVKFFKGLAK